VVSVESLNVLVNYIQLLYNFYLQFDAKVARISYSYTYSEGTYCKPTVNLVTKTELAIILSQ